MLSSFAALQAVEPLRQRLAAAPEDVGLRLRLAHSLFDAAAYREAIEHYEAVLAERPQDADVRTDLGIAYRRTGRSDLAARAFRRAIEAAPGHRNAHYNLGIVLAHDLDDPAGAAAAWERYLELAPDAANAGEVRRTVAALRRQAAPPPAGTIPAR